MIDQYPSPNGVLTSLIWRKTMSGGETSLSGYDNASQALSYTPGQEQVYLMTTQLQMEHQLQDWLHCLLQTLFR
jgi:hypothetical protein